jgi:hypothetical protein
MLRNLRLNPVNVTIGGLAVLLWAVVMWNMWSSHAKRTAPAAVAPAAAPVEQEPAEKPQAPQATPQQAPSNELLTG